jgi:DNA-binding LytR/AlgR family response regulator
MENRQFQSIAYSDIIDLVYDSPYVTIHSAKGNKLLLISLTKLIQYLPENFILCNRSTVINSLQIELYSRKDGIVRLKNGKTHLVSVRRRKEIETLLASIDI